MKRITVTLILLGISATGWACTLCNKQVMDGIYNGQFYPNLFTLLSAFLVLGFIVLGLIMLFTKGHNDRRAAHPNIHFLSPTPLTSASIILGIGLGGFIDGILFHQILQSHNMLSNKIPATDYVGKSINMAWDGIFHVFCLVVVFIGMVLLWKLLYKTDVDRSEKLFYGGLLLGWGLFNIVEGVLNHHVLKWHNVIELAPNHDLGNYTFLGISFIVLFVGYMLVKSRTHQLVTKIGHGNM